MQTQPLSLVWLRRDLRLHDHAAFNYAAKNSEKIQPVFIFDSEILARFRKPDDRRLTFIARALCLMETQLNKKDAGLLIIYGSPKKLIPELSKLLGHAPVIAARDYEPETRKRDEEVSEKTNLTLLKDQLIFEPTEILKGDGTPFKVFTPYSKQWLEGLSELDYAPYNSSDKKYADIKIIREKVKQAGIKVLDPAEGEEKILKSIGYKISQSLGVFEPTKAKSHLNNFVKSHIDDYNKERDFMAHAGTSRLSPYLRFGLVSVRELVRAVRAQKTTAGSATWLKELIWREFYAMILYNAPESARNEWNHAYQGISWSYNKEHFKAWQEGITGYPVVDAAMRELLQTGWMHNRARMIVASFLTKHLQIDWRWGEEHFAQYLMDYDLASNVGGWQWAASTGTDAQPYFRVFNPILQAKKYDPDGKYIRRFVPELAKLPDKEIYMPAPLFRPSSYPAPIVEHSAARAKAIAMFKAMKL